MSKYAKSIARGKAAEERFIKLAEERGHRCEATSRKDDIYRHTDYLVVVEGDHDWYVDVKAMKRINRSNTSAQDAEVWLEIRNVGGNNGWVYSPGYVAFEVGEGFIVVPKYDLALLIQEKVRHEFVKTAGDALYRLYTRAGRQDVLTRVKREDVEEVGELWKDNMGDD